MTAHIDFSKVNSRKLLFLFSQKSITKPSTKASPQSISKNVALKLPKVSVIEAPKVSVVTKTETELLEIKKLKAVYGALKRSGRYNQTDLNRIEKRLKNLE